MTLRIEEGVWPAQYIVSRKKNDKNDKIMKAAVERINKKQLAETKVGEITFKRYRQ